MKNNYLRRRLRQVLYDLKRKFGEDVEVYFEFEKVLDTRTGDINIRKEMVKVRRAIVLPENLNLGFVYSIQFIRANSNFAQGGYFHQGDRIFILDGKDLGEFKVTLNSYVMYQNQRYNVKDMTDLDQLEGILVICKRVEGQPIGQMQTKEIKTDVTASQTLESNNVLTIPMTTNVTVTSTVGRGPTTRPIQ